MGLAFGSDIETSFSFETCEFNHDIVHAGQFKLC